MCTSQDAEWYGDHKRWRTRFCVPFYGLPGEDPEEAQEILEKMKVIEEALYQTQNQSGQDPLNFPIRLNNKLAGLNRQAGVGNYPPTDQAVGVKNDITKQIDGELASLNVIMEQDVPAFNQKVKDAGVDFISSKKVDPVN